MTSAHYGCTLWSIDQTVHWRNAVAHRTVRSGYADLVSRLNKSPQGAPDSPLLRQILAILMSEKDAELLSRLPLRPFSAKKAARAWKTNEAEATRTLDEFAGRALLVDVELDDRTTYVLPPPMAGFFEFSLMRTRGDIDQKALSELFYQYLNVEEDFVRDLFTEGQTQLGRVFVQEPVLDPDLAAHVLDYERASQVIETASHIGVGMCYCRHKKDHLEGACDAPMNICMTFNASAESLVRHGHARKTSKEECLELLDQARETGLVQFGENVQRRVNFICNCCGCCCEALLASRRFAHLHPVHTSNYLPEVDPGECNGCGKCVVACPVEAMTLVSANDPRKPRRRTAKLDPELCLGCGVCARACAEDGIRLRERAARVITPVDNAQRHVMMAIERGKLQNLIFDNQVMASHRALGALLGVIFRLPPVKRALASEQLQSRFLRTVSRHAERMDGQEY
jgi:formate hydrogenlyase subunit 6/NADH:ubiquinone oxidoreductase subunit I